MHVLNDDSSPSVMQVPHSEGLTGECEVQPSVLIATSSPAEIFLVDIDAPPVVQPSAGSASMSAEVIILDAALASPAHDLARARRLGYE